MDNNVWVSGIGLQRFDKVKAGRWDKPGSGDILVSYPSVGYGGYGSRMNPNGFIGWSAPLLRWDTSKPLSGANGDPVGPSTGPLASGTNWAGLSIFASDGLCIDSDDNVWNTAYDNYIVKCASNATYLGTYNHGSGGAQGCVMGLNDYVWLVHSLSGSSVGHLANNGTLLGVVTVGSGLTGVAMDRMGKVWSANY